jgi:hypothetical protein
MAGDFDRRRRYSATRLVDLRGRLSHVDAVVSYPNLAIYVAGSFARGEASEQSDADMFFVHDDRDPSVRINDARLKTTVMMSGIIGLMDSMGLPAPLK